MNCLKLVQNFIRAIEANRKEEILGFFDEQSVFTNVPVGSVTGRDEIWKVLVSIHEHAISVDYQMHHIVSDEEKGVVLTERTDCYELPDRMVKFRAMGVFEIDKDKQLIREWRDYFDLKQSMDQLPQGTVWPE